MRRLQSLFKPQWWRFEWRYWRRQTPWDTQVTPPEVMDFIRCATPGRALDLGCGTGTNAITLTRYGWRTDGVDFSPKAITTARKKAAKHGMQIRFFIGDVTDLSFLEGPYQYILDIGCLFTLTPEQQQGYAAEITRLADHGADFMLYAWLPQKRGRRHWGISAQQVARLFDQSFVRTNMVKGRDGPGESAWYWFTRR